MLLLAPPCYTGNGGTEGPHSAMLGGQRTLNTRPRTVVLGEGMSTKAPLANTSGSHFGHHA
jgi:hypothetical protein